MEKIKHIENSIKSAENFISKIDEDIKKYPGMSSIKIRHFLNNLLELENSRYLEIGVNKGSTFISAIFKNSPEYTCAIDNWSEFGNHESEFLQNCKNYNIILSDFFNEDSFTLDIKKIKSSINVYLYDGNHDKQSQYKALTYYYDVLESEFIFMVDDYRNAHVVEGTQSAIKDLNLKKEFEIELKSGNNDFNSWWNGFYISILKK